MNIGTGGANVSFNNLQSVMRGAQVWNVNAQIGRYGRANDFTALDALRAQFGYGDREQIDQLWDILRGDALLVTGSEGDYLGQTTLDSEGRRVVSLTGYAAGMSCEKQMMLAIVLGHEAHRDGIVTDDNYLETRAAVMAHVQMANRMLDDGQNIAFNQTLAASMMALFVAETLGDMSIFNNFVDNVFDSSGDYWRVIRNTDGSVASVQYTGDHRNVTIDNADGTERTWALHGNEGESLPNALARLVGTVNNLRFRSFQQFDL